jgi:hypothetical protein
MLGMSPPAPDNILLGTAPHCSLFWGDFPKKKPIPKPAAQPAPKLFKMRRKVGKGFYSTAPDAPDGQ